MAEDSDAAKEGWDEKGKQEHGQGSTNVPFRLTLDKRIDLVIMGVIVLYGVFLIVESLKIPAGVAADRITAKGIPIIAGIFLIIVGMILGVMRLKTWSVFPGNLVPGQGYEDEEGHTSSAIPVFSIVVVTWLSVVLLKSLGYLIVTPLFMIVACWIMGARSLVKLIIFPVLYTVVTWYLFSQPLQFVLPLGFLTKFFRSLGLTP